MSLVSSSPAQNNLQSSDRTQVGRCTWRVVGAAVTGVSHQRLGLPCQDFQAHRILTVGAGQALLIALADGAGSAEHADLGARHAVVSVLDALEDSLTSRESAPLDFERIVREAFESAQQALSALAEREDLAVRSLATTLTCAISADGFFTVGQIGDGSVVVNTGQDELLAVTLPQRGEYANETFFLVQEDALEHLQVQVLHQPVQALAVLSDGLVRLALQLPANQPHGPFFKPLFSFAATSVDAVAAQQQLEAFLDSERVSERTDDDKSIVLAVCGDLAPDEASGEIKGG
jgi:serine/threonine protein phosphatase PrpC